MKLVGLGVDWEGMIMPVGLVGSASKEDGKLLCFSQGSGINVVLDGFKGVELIETDVDGETEMDDFNSKVQSGLRAYSVNNSSIVLHTMYEGVETLLVVSDLEAGEGKYINFVTGEVIKEAGAVCAMCDGDDFDDEFIDYELLVDNVLPKL